jgi:uncharacterized Tic20 family protein
VDAERLETPSREALMDREIRNLGMACHLAGLAQLVIPLGGPLAAFLLWVWKRDLDEFVEDQGREAVNFHLTWTLYEVATIFIAFTKIGWILLTLLATANLILLCLAADRAKEGVRFRYPLTIRILRVPHGAARPTIALGTAG